MKYCLLLAAILIASSILTAAVAPGGFAAAWNHEAAASALLEGYFIENAGQLRNDEVHYYGASAGLRIGFAESSVLLSAIEEPGLTLGLRNPPGPATNSRLSEPLYQSARAALVPVTFEGSNPVVPRAQGELPHRSHHFVGNDPSGWQTNVRHYRVIVYENLYDGIDLLYRFGQAGLKYEFVVHPGGDPASIRVAYEGREDLTVDVDGATLHTALGELVDSAPVAYQDDGVAVQCPFAKLSPRSLGFQCMKWDGSRTLVIDPLVYSRLLGGSSGDEGYGIATTSSGQFRTWVTGLTFSPDFALNPFDGFADAFVAKLDLFGNLLYATFLGGDGGEFGQGIEVDALGNVYVTGGTSSTDFPTPNGFDNTLNGDDAYVAKLDPTGILVSGTYLGGSPQPGSIFFGPDVGNDLAVRRSGSFAEVYVVGVTSSPDFPATVGAFDVTCGTDGVCNFREEDGFVGSDAFVARIKIPNVGPMSLTYATFLGGSGGEQGWGIAVDAIGTAYATGNTATNFGAVDFPVTLGAYDTTLESFYGVFVAKIKPDLTNTDPNQATPDIDEGDLLYSTFVAGPVSGAQPGFGGIAVDLGGNIYVTGRALGQDFPVTSGCYDTVFDGGYFIGDAFVAKIKPDLTNTDPNQATPDIDEGDLLYSTFLGGTDDEYGLDIAVDAANRVYVNGETSSVDFLLPNGFDTSWNGGVDVFVARLSASCTTLEYGTFLGGENDDRGAKFAIFKPPGNAPPDIVGIVVIGATGSSGFPTTMGSQLNGFTDAFVTGFTVP